MVVRGLQLKPLRGALAVRGRLAGAEVWRHAHGATACGAGEMVLGRWEGDGQYYYARILSPHPAGATVMWIDRDPSHRLVSWQHLVTASGTSCKEPHAKHEGWQDLARRSKARSLGRIGHIGVPPKAYTVCIQ